MARVPRYIYRQRYLCIEGPILPMKVHHPAPPMEDQSVYQKKINGPSKDWAVFCPYIYIMELDVALISSLPLAGDTGAILAPPELLENELEPFDAPA